MSAWILALNLMRKYLYRVCEQGAPKQKIANFRFLTTSYLTWSEVALASIPFVLRRLPARPCRMPISPP